MGKVLFIFGGEDDDRKCLNDLHGLNVETRSWSKIQATASTPEPRRMFSMFPIGDQIVIFGGIGKYGKFFKDCRIFSVKTFTWEIC